MKIIVTGSQSYSGTWVSLNELMVFGYYSDVAIPVTGINLSETSLSLEVGASHNLIEKFSPENASNRGVIWTSLNESIATVDDNGFVTAISAGEVTISVMTDDGVFADECSVVVKEENITTSILNATNKDEFSEGLKIFPNPLIGEMLTISLDKTGISSDFSLRIFNSVGKIVYSSNKIVFDNCTHQASFSLIRHLPKGLYIANLSDGHIILNSIIIAK